MIPTEKRQQKRARAVRRLALALLVGLGAAPAAAAEKLALYVDNSSPQASDQNTCTSPSVPCLTVHGAVAKVPLAARAVISIAPGIYPTPVDSAGNSVPINVFYWRFVTLLGPSDDAGDCQARPVLRASAPGIIAIAQDLAFLTVRCLHFDSTASGNVIGFQCRQIAICDIVDTSFGAMTTQIFAVQGASINFGGVNRITGSASSFLTVKQSQVSMADTFALGPGLAFSSFLTLLDGAFVDARNAVFKQTEAGSSGAQWSVRSGSRLALPGASKLPGNYQLNHVDEGSVAAVF